MKAGGKQRRAIVRDQDGKWFVRRVKYNRQDDIKGEVIYHCDRHISGPHDSLLDVPDIKSIVELCAVVADKEAAECKASASPDSDILAGQVGASSRIAATIRRLVETK